MRYVAAALCTLARIIHLQHRRRNACLHTYMHNDHYFHSQWATSKPPKTLWQNFPWEHSAQKSIATLVAVKELYPYDPCHWQTQTHRYFLSNTAPLHCRHHLWSTDVIHRTNEWALPSRQQFICGDLGSSNVLTFHSEFPMSFLLASLSSAGLLSKAADSFPNPLVNIIKTFTKG